MQKDLFGQDLETSGPLLCATSYEGYMVEPRPNIHLGVDVGLGVQRASIEVQGIHGQFLKPYTAWNRVAGP